MEKEKEGRELLKKIDKENGKITYIPALDCLIREKERECVERGIKFEKQSIPFGDIRISEYDYLIYSLSTSFFTIIFMVALA